MHCETRREWGRRVFWRAASRLVCAIGGEALDTKDPPLRPSLFLYMVLPPPLLSLRSERPSKKFPHRTEGTNFKPCFTATPLPPLSTDPPKDERNAMELGPPRKERKQDRLGKPREEGLVEGRRRELWARKKDFFCDALFRCSAEKIFSDCHKSCLICLCMDVHSR